MKYVVKAVAIVGILGAMNGADVQGQRSATLRLGGLMYDRGGDATNFMSGIGVDWNLSRHVLAEIDGSWSQATDFVTEYAGNPQTPRTVETATHLAAATIGVQAQAIFGRFRPYVGIANGLFVRYDSHDSGDRFLSRTTAFPVGIRIDVSERMALRGELRARFDVHQDGGSGTNVEQTFGVSLRF